MTRINKNLRHTILEQQDRTCALCKGHISDIGRARYDKQQQRMVCIPCNFVILYHRDTIRRGIMHEQIVAYEALDAQPTPEKIKRKLTPAQERGRQAVVDGRVPGMTVERWDRTYGTERTETTPNTDTETQTETQH